MPIYVATLDSCDSIPTPDFIFRADNMVSAVMKCQEALEKAQGLAEGTKVVKHDLPVIKSIDEVDGIELMDDEGITDMVALWKELAEK